MASLAKIHEATQTDMTGGFQHITIPASRVVDRVAEAAIRSALDAGDTARAERLRSHWWGFKEKRN